MVLTPKTSHDHDSHVSHNLARASRTVDLNKHIFYYRRSSQFPSIRTFFTCGLRFLYRCVGVGPCRETHYRVRRPRPWSYKIISVHPLLILCPFLLYACLTNGDLKMTPGRFSCNVHPKEREGKFLPCAARRQMRIVTMKHLQGPGRSCGLGERVTKGCCDFNSSSFSLHDLKDRCIGRGC